MFEWNIWSIDRCGFYLRPFVFGICTFVNRYVRNGCHSTYEIQWVMHYSPRLIQLIDYFDRFDWIWLTDRNCLNKFWIFDMTVVRSSPMDLVIFYELEIESAIICSSIVIVSSKFVWASLKLLSVTLDGQYMNCMSSIRGIVKPFRPIHYIYYNLLQYFVQ